MRDLSSKKEIYTGNELIGFNGLDYMYTYKELFPFIATPNMEEFRYMHNNMAEVVNGVAPIFMNHNIDELNDWQLTPTKDFRDYRFSNAIFCLILAAPPYRKADVALYYEEYFKIRQYVFDYIRTNINILLNMFYNSQGQLITFDNIVLFRDFPWSKNINPAKRLQNIVTNAHNASKGRVEQTLNNVEFYLKGEDGTSLYQMYTNIKRYNQIKNQ